MGSLSALALGLGDQVRPDIKALRDERLLEIVDLSVVCVPLHRSPFDLRLLALVRPYHPALAAFCLELDGGYRGPGG